MGSAADVLQAARTKLGYNGQGTCDSPDTIFGSWAGVQTQWCAEFCSWALAAGGVGSDERLGRFNYGEDYCPAWVANFQTANRWHTAPQPGHLVFYSWDLNDVADHVGLVESVEADGSIVTIEGNTDDPSLADYACGNCCRRKRRSTRYVLGYGHPIYSDDAASSPVRPGMYELIRNAEGRVIAAGPGFWCDTTRDNPQATRDAIAQLQRSALCINPAPRDVRDAEMVLLHDLWITKKES